MNKKNNILYVIIISLILVILFLVYIQFSFLKEKPPIKIGFVGFLDSQTSNANRALDAIKIAIEEINEQGGIKDSKVEIVVYSPKSEEEVEFYFKKLAEEDKVIAVLSTLVNNSDVPERLKIPTILLGQNVLTIARKEPFYWSIENSYSAGDYLFIVMRRLNFTFQPVTAMMVTDFSPFTGRFHLLARRHITLAGINDLGYHTFYEQNLSKIVDDIKKRNPGMIVLNTNTDNTIKFLREAKKQELNPKLYLTGFEVPKEILKHSQELPENLYFSSYITAGEHDLNSKPEDEFDVVDHKLIKRNGNYMTPISLNAYDSVYIIKNTIEKSKISNKESTLDEDRAKLISNLWRTINFRSLRGTISADGKSGFLRRTYSTIITVENGQFKPWIP